MATFTMNSQNTFVKAAGPKNIFDKAFVFSIALIVIVGGIWIVERVLIYITERQITNFQEVSANSLNSVSQEDINVTHDVTSRIATINSMTQSSLQLDELFSAIERSTIPQTKLTSYEYKTGGAISIVGVTADYRFLAEQLLRYRQEPLFSTAVVNTNARTDDGQISFIIDVAPAITPASTEGVIE